MKTSLRILFIGILLLVSLVGTTPTPAAAVVCPTAANVARGQITRYLPSTTSKRISAKTALSLPAGNVANLQYADNPQPMWLVNGAWVSPSWSFVYVVQFYDRNGVEVGRAWFATLERHSADVLFYFIMPQGEQDHPNCGYGSINRASIDRV